MPRHSNLHKKSMMGRHAVSKRPKGRKRDAVNYERAVVRGSGKRKKGRS